MKRRTLRRIAFFMIAICLMIYVSDSMKENVSGSTKTGAKGIKSTENQVAGFVGKETENGEEAFTADDLKKYLENEGKTGNTGDKDTKNGKDGNNSKDSRSSGSNEADKEERWRQFMELSVNGVVSDNETVSENDTEDDDSDVNPAEDEVKYYAPPKGEEWKLLLVNKQNPIPDDYDAKLVNINKSARIREEIALPLAEMFEDAADEGVALTVCSAYRSHEHQQDLFDAKIKGYTRQGLSYLDAFRIGSYSVIIPGTSEHELGMALDIVTPGYQNLNEGFADTKAGRWLAVNAYKYGFILRYPEGKEYITGITYEPWHFRYVGKEAAKDIYDSGLTLEEYLDAIGWS